MIITEMKIDYYINSNFNLKYISRYFHFLDIFKCVKYKLYK